MRFIYGTNNPAKLTSMAEMLSGLPLEILSLADAPGPAPTIDESGNDPLHNAQIKALGYYQAYNMPVFSCDSGLYIEGLPDKEQPGVHVRRVNGQDLSDAQMMAHYAAIARRLGGKCFANYQNAISLVLSPNEIISYAGDDISGERFLLTDAPHSQQRPGFPLDSLSVQIQSGRYYYDLPKTRLVSSTQAGFRAFFCRVLQMIQG